ncbi:MAG: hypothetical protein AAF665_11910 [Pseudomonadota bacterium]
MRFRPAVFAFVVAAGCVSLPEVPDPEVSIAQDAQYPDFVPLNRVVLKDSEADEENEETRAELQARVAALKARAADLRDRQID